MQEVWTRAVCGNWDVLATEGLVILGWKHVLHNRIKLVLISWGWTSRTLQHGVVHKDIETAFGCKNSSHCLLYCGKIEDDHMQKLQASARMRCSSVH